MIVSCSIDLICCCICVETAALMASEATYVIQRCCLSRAHTTVRLNRLIHSFAKLSYMITGFEIGRLQNNPFLGFQSSERTISED